MICKASPKILRFNIIVYPVVHEVSVRSLGASRSQSKIVFDRVDIFLVGSAQCRKLFAEIDVMVSTVRVFVREVGSVETILEYENNCLEFDR